jgi:hypothetical protein
MDDFEKPVDRAEQDRTRPTTVPSAAAALARAAGGLFKLAAGRVVRSVRPGRS